MSKKYKTKTRTKKIVAGIVAAVVAIAALAGIIALFRPNTKDKTIEINPKFTTGALSATTGKYTETEASLYTKEVFDATGLQVEVDFDGTVSYQLFYYDEDGAFLAASAVLTENHTAVLPEGTDGARMVITPDWTDVDEDEQVIAWYDVNKYVDQLKLTITNPDYVEVEDGDEGGETSNKWTHENLEIYSEYWGCHPGTYVQDGGEPNYLELDAGANAATFKPVSMKAGDYYVCFNINSKTITGPTSYIYSFMYKNESGDGYEGEFQQALGEFIESDATVDGFEYAVKINLPRDAEVYIACDVGILPTFTVIKA